MNSIEIKELIIALKNHAYCMAMSMRAYGLIAAMQADNEYRKAAGQFPVYGKEDFEAALNECQQDHNSVIMNMRNGIF